jgi:hypothetical protein
LTFEEKLEEVGRLYAQVEALTDVGLTKMYEQKYHTKSKQEQVRNELNLRAEDFCQKILSLKIFNEKEFIRDFESFKPRSKLFELEKFLKKKLDGLGFSEEVLESFLENKKNIPKAQYINTTYDEEALSKEALPEFVEEEISEKIKNGYLCTKKIGELLDVEPSHIQNIIWKDKMGLTPEFIRANRELNKPVSWSKISDQLGLSGDITRKWWKKEYPNEEL